MSYITKVFDRLDLQHIREFLLYGGECRQVSEESYQQRLEAAGNPAFQMLDEKFPDTDERDKIAGAIHHYVSVTQDVYMEIGMQCGAVLSMGLLANPQKE